MPGEEPLEQAGLRFQISIYEEALREDADDTEALAFLAHAYTLVGRVQDGLATDRRLVELLPDDPRVRYNLACSCALAGLADEAFDVLEQACGLGFDDVNLLRKDKDLDPLRDDARFKAIEARLAADE